MLLSVREYATSRFITYEAARRQVIRYKKELLGKIEIKARTQYLTDQAIEFLDQHRKDSPVTVYREKERKETEAQKSELEDLRGKYTALLEKVTMMQEEHARERIALNDKVEMLYQKQIELLEANTEKRKKWFWQK
jgi:hypothetical protein